MARHFLLGMTVPREADESDSPTKKVPAGIYSNNTELYTAIITAHLAKDEPKKSRGVARWTPEKIRSYEFEDLLIKLPSGVKNLNYARLNSLMRREDKIVIVDDTRDITAFSIWIMTMNAPPKEH